MSRHFVVGVEPLSKEQEEEFRAFVRNYSGSWWHWINNLWLLRFPEDSAITQNALWEILAKQNPNARIIIMETNADNWTVSDYTNSKGLKMDAWLAKNWSSDHEE